MSLRMPAPSCSMRLVLRVHEARRLHDSTARDGDDRLVSETHAEDRHAEILLRSARHTPSVRWIIGMARSRRGRRRCGVSPPDVLDR